VDESKRLWKAVPRRYRKIRKNNCPVNSSRRSNKLTNNMNNICNIWTSNGEIYQTPNNSAV
jgi:hypothetical protein